MNSIQRIYTIGIARNDLPFGSGSAVSTICLVIVWVEVFAWNGIATRELAEGSVSGVSGVTAVLVLVPATREALESLETMHSS